jgi:antitoxin ParD1/3/4
MASTLNLSLTDELRDFIDRNCGDGTLYATPSEFVCDLLRQKKLQMEAATARDGILAGYQNAVEDRVVRFEGDLRKLLSDGSPRAEAKSLSVHLQQRQRPRK